MAGEGFLIVSSFLHLGVYDYTAFTNCYMAQKLMFIVFSTEFDFVSLYPNMIAWVIFDFDSISIS